MSLRRPHWLSVTCVLAMALCLSACNTSPEQLNRAAQVVLTRSAEITPGALASSDLDEPTRDPNAAPITATPSLVFALCIVRAESQLRIEPNDDAASTAPLQASEVITAYGRTADAAWVLGWNKDDHYGWVTANVMGCTVPTLELMPTEPNVLRLTPVAVVAEAATDAATDAAATAAPAQAESAPSPSPESTPAASAKAAIPPTVVSTNTPAPQPPAPTNTTELSTATAVPEPTATSDAVAVAPAVTPTPIIMIQIVTVVVTVTAAPAEAVVTPTLALTFTPASRPRQTPTAAATTTATIAATPALTSTAVTTSSLVVLQQVRCVITPGTPVNLRRGPARSEQLLGTLRAGAPFVVTGRNEDGQWLYGVTARGTIGWLITSAVTCESDVNTLPVVDR